MTVLLYTTMTIFLLICFILIGLILIQKGRGGGLASAFGGAGGQTAFGSKTGDVLTWATSVVFAIFVVLAVALNLISNQIDKTRGGNANAAVVTNQPVMPGSPGSSMPKAPSGDPAIANPPPVNTQAGPTTRAAAPEMNPLTPPPTTMPALVTHVPLTTVPTTLP